MPLINDPDDLVKNTEIVFDTTGKTIQLLIAGNLSTTGVTLQAVYSRCKELWKTDSALIKFPFPLTAITEQKFDLINGWDFKDATTRNLIRNAGWALKDATNVSKEEYMGFVTLGDVSTGQVYYQQVAAGSATNVVLTGAANQAVKIYGDATHDDFDYRGYFKCFVREYQKLYDQSQLSAIGLSTVTYQVYAFPLSNQADLKITHDDEAMTGDPYSSMSITYYGTNQAKTVGGVASNFRVVVEANGGTKEQIYEFVQYKLRQDADIDAGAGTVKGKTADSLMHFVGDTLLTSNGVFIENFAAVDTNNIKFYDVLGAEVVYPYISAGRVTFNDNLINDADAIYRMYFTDGFGTASALLVNDKDGSPISGTVGGAGYIDFSFAYAANVQRGAGTNNTDAPVTIVAIGLSTGQYVSTTGTILRSNANAFSLVSSLERNYSNPV